jgi:hypothetical protein
LQQQDTLIVRQIIKNHCVTPHRCVVFFYFVIFFRGKFFRDIYF